MLPFFRKAGLRPLRTVVLPFFHDFAPHLLRSLSLSLPPILFPTQASNLLRKVYEPKVKQSKHKYGTRLDKKDTVPSPVRTTVVLLVLCWCTTYLKV